jgi:hypothetical protein
MPRSAFASISSKVLLGSALACVGGGACSQAPKTPGQLVVAIDTDMALPEQIDVIELVVTANGNTLLDNPMPVGVGTNTQTIPATLTLVAGSDPDLPATIRVIGWRNNQPRTLREIVTPVPTDRVALLRMPVQWLCDGTVAATATDDGGAGGGYASTCGAGMTCEAGSCVTSKVPDPSTLETYTPQAVFGGAQAPMASGASTMTTSGTCFDTVPCLAAGTVMEPDADCTVPTVAGGMGMNVGLRVNGDGICDQSGTTCFVGLDGNSDEGWKQQKDRVALPPAVCKKMHEGTVAGVVVSTSCPTKTVATPPCGPWSSVAPAVDAGTVRVEGGTQQAPTAPSLVGTVASEAGAEAPCCPLMADASKLYTCLCASSASGAAAVPVVSIDPTAGTVASAASFAPASARTRYSTALAGGNVYWVDRQQGDAGVSCPVYATSVAGGATTPVGVVGGDVYDQADVLADAQSVYVLADSVAGLAPGASPLQLVSVDRTSGAVTAHDTGGARPVFQMTEDGSSVYVGVDTDVSQGDGGASRTSTVVGFAGAAGTAKTVAQSALTTDNASYGGYIGLVDDGTSLFALYQAAPAADGTVDTQIQKLDASGAAPATVYDEVADPTVSALRLLGASGGAVVFVRDVAGGVDGGPASPESSVLVLPAGQTSPRIVAGFVGDSPVFELATPSFTPDVFWMNASGKIFRLPSQVLK